MKLERLLRIWGILYYLEAHASDPPSSRQRGTTAIAGYLKNNHRETRKVLDECERQEFIHGDLIRGKQPTTDPRRRNPKVYEIRPLGADHLRALDKVLRPYYFPAMKEMMYRTGRPPLPEFEYDRRA